MGSESLAVKASTLLEFRQLKDEDDLLQARSSVKMHAVDLGFSAVNQVKMVTAASELGRNVLEHGDGGSISIEMVKAEGRVGIRLIFEDQGPGIPDLHLALSDGYTSKKGLGLGLSGSKRLMDEFDISSAVGAGTKIAVTKWT